MQAIITSIIKRSSAVCSILLSALMAQAAWADYEVSRIGGVFKAGDNVREFKCAKGLLPVGARFKGGTYVDLIQLKCSAPLSKTTLGTPKDGPSTSFAINPAEVFIPGVSSREKTVFCPQHYVMSGIKAQGAGYVDRINSIRCTRFRGTTAKYKDVGVGGNGGATVRAYCNAAKGDVAKSFQIKGGFWLDGLKTFCRAQ